MNVAATAEKKLSSPTSLFQRFLPEKGERSIFFWTSLPSFLLLLNLGISFLKPCAFTAFLPFLAFVSSLLTFRFKTLGLSGSYFAICLFVLMYYPQLSQEEKLWQMGVVFTQALTIFILLLSIEEAAACDEEVSRQTKELHKRMQQAESDYLLVKKTAEEKEKEFKQEIEKLKNEAELRRIEKINQTKQFELVQSEIEMLTLQKEEFVTDARKAREELAHQRELVEEKHSHFEKTVRDLREEAVCQKELLEEQICRQKEELIASQEAILVLQQRPEVVVEKVIIEEDKELKRAYLQMEGIAKQMRSQFNEKTQMLVQTRKELFATEGKLLALEQENRLAKFDPERDEMKLLEKEIALLSEEIERLEQEILLLEQLVSLFFH